MKKILYLVLLSAMAAQAQEQKWDKYKNVGIEAQKFKSTAMGVTTDARDTLMTTLVTGELVKIAIDDIGISGGGSTAWGDITGTLSNQTDLQSALDLKANTSSLASYLPLSGGTMTGT